MSHLNFETSWYNQVIGGEMQNFTRGIPHKTPFYYGWVIFGLASGMSLVAPVFAVATLSIFIIPMGD